MNLSTVALLLLAWQLLSSQNTQKQNLTDFLSADTKNMLDCVTQLSSNGKSGTDKMGTILQMMSNPLFAELAGKMFGGGQKEAPPPPQQTDFTNDEGYKFKQPSAASQEFFKPIENIADPEVKNKLYRMYEDWYVT